jgi:hypothetical protein
MREEKQPSDRPEVEAYAYKRIEDSLDGFIRWLDANPDKDVLSYDEWKKFPIVKAHKAGDR